MPSSQYWDRSGVVAGQRHVVAGWLHGICVRLIGRRDHQLKAVADRDFVRYRRQRDRHRSGRLGSSPPSLTGATSSWGSTAELGLTLLRPFCVLSISGPRSQSDANRVAPCGSRHVKVDATASNQRQWRGQRFAGKASRLTRQYAEGVPRHAGSPTESAAGPGKVGQRSGRTARRGQDALLFAAQCDPLIRQIGPAARVRLSDESLRVAGATILPQQRCLGTRTENEVSVALPSRFK